MIQCPEVNWEINALVAVQSSAQGSFQYGIGYNPTDDFHLIHVTNFTHNGSLTELKTGFTVDAKVYVLATLVVNVDCIGGPDIGVKPYLEAAISMENDYTDPCYEYPKLSSNWGLQGTIGGRIDIGFKGMSIYKHEFPSTSIFNIKSSITFNT